MVTKYFPNVNVPHYIMYNIHQQNVQEAFNISLYLFTMSLKQNGDGSVATNTIFTLFLVLLFGTLKYNN